jgi:hypothetical protein
LSKDETWRFFGGERLYSWAKIEAKNEAEARAEFLIYLLQQKLETKNEN